MGLLLGLAVLFLPGWLAGWLAGWLSLPIPSCLHSFYLANRLVRQRCFSVALPAGWPVCCDLTYLLSCRPGI
ncbi:hypothetical protein F5Y01DRAFT_297001 [Xylaria sp. FL0043]|nr:hypothetical protein F5Y01DRAFT_297001 [Xylaria sp. FL0043]